MYISVHIPNNFVIGSVTHRGPLCHYQLVFTQLDE